MSSLSSLAGSIHIVGDAVIDWMLLVDSRGDSDPDSQQSVLSHSTGTVLLTQIIEASATAVDPNIRVYGPSVADEAETDIKVDNVNRSFTTWKLQNLPLTTPSGTPSEPVLRMVERLGRERGKKPTPSVAKPHLNRDAPLCVVIDEDDLSFRKDLSPLIECLSNLSRRPDHILYKTTAPFDLDPVVKLLIARGYSDVLTIYCALKDLRHANALIGRPLSWERTAQEIVKAIIHERNFQLARRVIVSIGLAGAVFAPAQGAARLIFDPKNQEDEWESLFQGKPRAIGKCIVGSLAIEAIRNVNAPEWIDAIERGLRAGREAHARGLTLSSNHRVKFPIEEVVEAIRDSPGLGPTPFAIAEIRAMEKDPNWRILTKGSKDDYFGLAKAVVNLGPMIPLADVPLEKIGNWISVDRSEIEGMRAVRNVILEYIQRANVKKPLNIAVFGDPGSGKSFAIRELETQLNGYKVDGSKKIEFIETNLSQLSSTTELHQRLQRVRDCSIKGKMPLAFFDEFDSPLDDTQLGWLIHFLAPMQDGTFLEHGENRPLGPAIFVFAGGLSRSLRSFEKLAETTTRDNPGVKATDFASRLRGHVDIMGLNPREGAQDDYMFMVRRALLLRAALTKSAPSLFLDSNANDVIVQPTVLSAFLRSSRFHHGARSMEAIVEMSALTGEDQFRPSALPASNQLNLHVNAKEFMALAAGAPPTSGLKLKDYASRLSSGLSRMSRTGSRKLRTTKRLP